MKKSTLFIISSLFISSLMFSSCRAPVEDADYWVPVINQDFDASAIDDGGAGELCSGDNDVLFNNAYSPFIGGTDSVDLVVLNFSYFRCPHCAHFAELAKKVWAENPEIMSRVRLYYHHFPFSNQTAWLLHASTHAAHNQGLSYFWAMHDYIYDNMNKEEYHIVTASELRDFAEQQLQLDMYQFDLDVDMTSDEGSSTYAFLEWDKSQAQNAGISGTPSVFICGEKISWGNIESIVKNYLK